MMARRAIGRGQNALGERIKRPIVWRYHQCLQGDNATGNREHAIMTVIGFARFSNNC